MTSKQHWRGIFKLAEEIGEYIEASCGFDVSRVQEEIADLTAALGYFLEQADNAGALDGDRVVKRTEERLEELMKGNWNRVPALSGLPWGRLLQTLMKIAVKPQGGHWDEPRSGPILDRLHDQLAEAFALLAHAIRELGLDAESIDQRAQKKKLLFDGWVLTGVPAEDFLEAVSRLPPGTTDRDDIDAALIRERQGDEPG